MSIDKDPTSYSLLTYAWVSGLAAIGGFVSFVQKVKLGYARAFNMIEFIGELVTSAFAGVITFWLCEASNVNPLATAALVGVTGHMGSRALYLLEQIVGKHFPHKAEK